MPWAHSRTTGSSGFMVPLPLLFFRPLAGERFFGAVGSVPRSRRGVPMGRIAGTTEGGAGGQPRRTGMTRVVKLPWSAERTSTGAAGPETSSSTSGPTAESIAGSSASGEKAMCSGGPVQGGGQVGQEQPVVGELPLGGGQRARPVPAVQPHSLGAGLDDHLRQAHRPGGGAGELFGVDQDAAAGAVQGERPQGAHRQPV